MVEVVHRYNEAILAPDPLWPAEAVRHAFGSTGQGPVPFSEFAKYHLATETLTPDALKQARNVVDQLAPVGANPKTRELLQCLYNEGTTLSHLLGEHALTTKYPNLTPAEIQKGIEHFGSLEKFAGYAHIRHFLNASVAVTKFEYLRDAHLLNEQDAQKGLEVIKRELDAAGHNGITRLIAAHPDVVEHFHADTRPITVSFARGEETHGIPKLSSKTRSAYINDELRYADEISTHSPEIAERYKAKAYTHAAGEEYITQQKMKMELLQGIAAEKPIFANRQQSPQALVQEVAESMMQGTAEAEMHGAIKAGDEFVHRYGLAFLDPKFIDTLEQKGHMTPATLATVDWAIHAGGTSFRLPHIRGRSQATPQEPLHATERPALAAPVSGVSQESTEIQTQKKTPAITEAGPNPSATPQEKASATSRPPSSNGTGKAAETLDSEASTQAAHVSGWKLAGSALFGLAVIDGLTNLRVQDDKEKDKKKISFGRVIETSIGVAGLAATWLMKDSMLTKVTNNLKR